MESEMRLVADELRQRATPVEFFTEKRLIRRQLPLAADILVMGYVPVVLAALRQLKVALPVLDSYPVCLRPFLSRRVWESTVGWIVARLHEGGEEPLFARPRSRMKRFTGTVFAAPEDIAYMEGASSKTPVYCSEVVRWRSEYRVFVKRHHIVGIRHYAGDNRVPADESVVSEAVRLFSASGDAPAGYAIDFGVLAGSGTTALVEVNDGFSLGAYGLDPASYTDLVIARWCELTKSDLNAGNGA